MTQQEAIDCMLAGNNVFLTGAPGAGKTYTLNRFIEQAEDAGKNVAITASTGIAASHIGGITIHSWSGLGIKEEVTKADLKWMEGQKRLVKRFQLTDVLVIDEVSMLHGYRLDMLNKVAKHMRNKDLPFGGMQVILVGDLFQLPPVNRESNVLDFVHLSDTWAELDLTVCYITEQHRQGADDLLLDLLQGMRDNKITSVHKKLLSNRLLNGADNLTRLFSHNADVDTINQEKLDALPGKVKKYYMRSDGDKRAVEALRRNLLAPEILEIKVDAEVMFVANNFEAGFVNGTRGRVVKFKKGIPIVKTLDGRFIRVEPHEWKTKQDGITVATVEQLPIRLAWAITIHKSQGMSLDAAIIDLSRAFMPGMGYVALSRVRSLDGLYLQGINDEALKMHEQIYDFDLKIRGMV